MSHGILKWFSLGSQVFLLLTMLLWLMSSQVNARLLNLDFSLHKHQTDNKGPTLLVIGGIQGDEPGGFNAASLLVTDYVIKKGEMWVVPNLNFESIIKRSRGVYGDMNRKFHKIKKTDPEYLAIQKIKSIILDEEVDIVLNLHDGSGFYRKKYIDKLHNPHRWGQSIIIDQKEIPRSKFGELNKIAQKVTSEINGLLDYPEYQFRVKNTHTREGNKEMEKTLTYFSVRHNKPAFAVEASKHFITHKRTYYHLQAVEAFMRQMGIEYDRKFRLDMAQVKQRIDNNIRLSLYDKKIYLDMAKARSRLGYVPMKKNAPLQFAASNPLMAIIGEKRHFKVRYGNRHITLLHPEYIDFDSSLNGINVLVDGQRITAEFGSVVSVGNEFMVPSLKGYRVNVIGYRQRGLKNESGVTIRRNEIEKRFSIDKAAKLFRVELYRENSFCGMILVRFREEHNSNRDVAYSQYQ